MNKVLKNLRISLVLGLLLISSISLAKVRIRGDFDIWIGNSNSRSKDRKGVGNIDDKEFEEKPFIINGIGYAFLKNNQGDKLLLKVIFDKYGNIIREDLFYTYRFTVNCLSVYGDNSKCLTLTDTGVPAVWDRLNSKYIYYGKFLNNVRINNPYKRKGYYEEDFFGDLFQF